MILNHNTPRSNHALRQNQTIHTPISSNATLSPSLVGIKPSVCTVRWAKLSPFFPRAREHREKLHRLSVRAGKSFTIPPPFSHTRITKLCQTTARRRWCCREFAKRVEICFRFVFPGFLSLTLFVEGRKKGGFEGEESWKGARFCFL